MNKMNKDSIVVGYPLDLLLNRTCKLKDFEENWNFYNWEKVGGIILPDEIDPGTGNIVIRGRPGTGKSTLAIQIAVACTLNPNKYDSIYLSLEERPHNVRQKANSFGWDKYIQQLKYINNLDQFSTPYELGKTLAIIFSQIEENCPLCKEVNANKLHVHKKNIKLDRLIKNHVLVPSLSPRNLTVSDKESGKLFWDRYQQLEKLLSGAKYLRDKNNRLRIKEEINQLYIPDIRLICIDSLNVFGDKLLTREELFKIFDLFKKYEMIGVFVVEEDEREILSPDSRLHGDMIEYLADVVISLSSGEDHEYYMRYFEIVKSRYQHQIYGKHPFKIHNFPGKTDSTASLNMNTLNRSGLIIYPSLHYIVLETERT